MHDASPCSVFAENPCLERDVHVWSARIAADARELLMLEATLAPDELSRARRFRFQRDRDQYVICRGRLRTLLARYVDAEPSELKFSYGAYGKPALDGESIEFNLSHAGGMAVYAIARGRRVGIDVEPVRDIPESGRLAENFFSPFEIEELRRTPIAWKDRALLTCWTRKEAYLKAIGEGLSRRLDEREPPAEACWLETFSPAPGYVASVAVLGGRGSDERTVYRSVAELGAANA